MATTVVKTVTRYGYRVIAVSKDKTRIKAIVEMHGVDGPFGHVYFVESDEVPPSTQRDGMYDIYYRYEDFPAIVDMLRNEEQVFMVYQGAEDSLLSTTSEAFEG